MQAGLSLREDLDVGQGLEPVIVLQNFSQLLGLGVQLTLDVVDGLFDGGDLVDDVVGEEVAAQLRESLEELFKKGMSATVCTANKIVEGKRTANFVS